MTVIYIDRVFVLNAIMDYLLILTAAQLIGAPLRRWRFAAAAGIGGLYAAAVFYLPWLQFPLIRLAVGILLPCLSFWGIPNLWRHVALFLLLSGTLAGILLAFSFISGTAAALVRHIYYADISYPVLILSGIVFYVLLQILFRQEARYGRGELMDITVSLCGKNCRVRALYDTGNMLQNPIDGKSVLVAETTALYPLWSRDIREILSGKMMPEEKLTLLYEKGSTAFSLLPFCGVGGENGLMLAVRSDYIQIGRRICPKTLVALSQNRIGSTAYHALWGGKGETDALICEDSSMDIPTQAG